MFRNVILFAKLVKHLRNSGNRLRKITIVAAKAREVECIVRASILCNTNSTHACLRINLVRLNYNLYLVLLTNVI